MSRNALICLVICCWSALSGALAGAPPAVPKPPAPPRARVVIAQGTNLLDSFTPLPDKVRPLLERGLIYFTGKADAKTAWRSLVSPKDVVGIKVFSTPGAVSGTRPAVTAAVVEGLLAAGVPPKNIVVWDRQLADLRRAGYEEFVTRYGIRVAGSQDAGWDEKVFYDSALLGSLVFGDLEFGRKGEGIGRKSFVSRLLTRDITKIINLTPLLNHNQAGVSGSLHGLALGSVDNVIRFEADMGRLTLAVPEIYALPALGDRVVLNIVDALLCQYEGEERTLLHYSTKLNQLRFSTDPVALDVLSIEELNRQREARQGNFAKKMAEAARELYHNAALLELGVAAPRRITVEVVP